MAEPDTESVELTGGGLRLRSYRSEDAVALLAAVRESVDSVGRWLPWCHSGYDASDAETWIRHCAESWRSGEHFSFATFEIASGQYLGGFGLNQRSRLHNFMNLGYWVRASRQRHGIAVRAAHLVATFGFEQLGLSRIEIVAELDNLASRRVAEVLGATFEGIGRNRLVARGQPTDAAVYSLIPAKVRANREP
jgi:RimJ/RimL family protein N-acetyltransferase